MKKKRSKSVSKTPRQRSKSQNVDSLGYEMLPRSMTKHGHDLFQVWRNRDSAIYRYRGGFEVIRIKKRAASEVFGRKYPPREVYPSDSEWGFWAITRPGTDKLEYLKLRAKQLCDRKKAKEVN